MRAILCVIIFLNGWVDLYARETLPQNVGHIQRKGKLEQILRNVRSGPQPHISFEKFNTYEEIMDYVDYLGKAFPDIAKPSIIGHSAEGRPIPVVTVSTGSSKNKPGILIDAGIHAREWAAPAVALYLLYQLVENYRKNKAMADQLEWYIIPILNPDGYKYSMTKDRMWRKNRANTTNPACRGVDLNRNFDVFFGGQGTSLDPCDETYVGPGPFSEPEAQALRNFALSKRGKIKVYMTLHSYGQYFLYPWGFGDVLPKDWKDLDRLARIAEKALSSVRGTHYDIGSSTRLLGPAAGGSDDWMKAKCGIKYSYTVELTGGGNEGFDLPPVQIFPVCAEMFEAFKLIALTIYRDTAKYIGRTT